VNHDQEPPQAPPNTASTSTTRGPAATEGGKGGSTSPNRQESSASMLPSFMATSENSALRRARDTAPLPFLSNFLVKLQASKKKKKETGGLKATRCLPLSWTF